MKKIILFIALSIGSLTNASNANSTDCISYLAANTKFSAQAISGICEDSTRHTPLVLYRSLTLGFQYSDSLKLLAGEASAWTEPCLNHMIYYFKESYSLSMICRDISEKSYSSLVNPANERLIRGGYAPTVAQLFSPDSFKSFTRAFYKTEGFEYCRIYDCN